MTCCISVDNKVKKQRKTKRKPDTVVDMSTGIIDIEDTPDVATWNKKIHMKVDSAGIVDKSASNYPIQINRYI